MRAGEIRRPFWDSSTSQRPERPPDRLTERDPVARLERRGDVDDQADPAAAMVDDQRPRHSRGTARRSGPVPAAGAVTGAPREVARVSPRERTPLALTAPSPSVTGRCGWQLIRKGRAQRADLRPATGGAAPGRLAASAPASASAALVAGIPSRAAARPLRPTAIAMSPALERPSARGRAQLAARCCSSAANCWRLADKILAAPHELGAAAEAAAARAARLRPSCADSAAGAAADRPAASN